MASITINTDELKFDNDKVEIKMDKDFLYINNKEYIEKQQLISFLEDKIKEYEGYEKYLYEKQNTKLVEKARIGGCISVYKEVLDFVRGGKDE